MIHKCYLQKKKEHKEIIYSAGLYHSKELSSFKSISFKAFFEAHW